MPLTQDHLTIAAGSDAVHELEVKRSRFLGVLRRVAGEPAARALVAELRGRHHAARHHCSAFVIGPGRELQRSSDDGEPSGTAGTPMLRALLGHEGGATAAGELGPLSDVAVVVVRYFGGTLLGAGGLARAYAAAVAGTLDAATLVRHEHRRLHRLTLAHDVAGRISHELHAADVTVRSTEYATDGLRLVVAVPDRPEASVRFARWLDERQLAAEDAGSDWIDVPLA